MLIQFSFENYLSFHQEQVFSLLATNDPLHPSHRVSDVPYSGEATLRAAALYGANGAGKSNLVQAIKFAQELILTGTRGTQPLPLRPFKLAAEPSQPSKFEFLFHTQGTLYNYGFRLDALRIQEEWLFATPKTQEVLLFQRTTSEQGQVEVEFGPQFTGRAAKDRQFLQFVAQGTRPNQLFLTEAQERNVPAVQPVTEWFRDALIVIPAEARAMGLELEMHRSQPDADFIAFYLHAAGTGIDHIDTQEVPIDVEIINPLAPEKERELARQQVESLEEDEMVWVIGPTGRPILVTKGHQGQPVQIRLVMQHRASDGHLVPFDLTEESDGTQRLIHLLPALRMLKLRSEKVVVIDELDRRFHTLLSRFFIQQALHCDDEHQRSQFIFTTHDTNLLDLDLLRRDEIWFVEKDPGGASHLYSLAEFKVRPDLKIEKGYLAGRFGAIPFAGTPSQLGWTAASDQPLETAA